MKNMYKTIFVSLIIMHNIHRFYITRGKFQNPILILILNKVLHEISKNIEKKLKTVI
jgi:hypothetical protein